MSDVNDDWLPDVCQFGRGEHACRYLTNDPKGFACGKLDPRIASTVNAWIADGTLETRGDNCDGLPPTQIIPSTRWREGGEP